MSNCLTVTPTALQERFCLPLSAKEEEQVQQGTETCQDATAVSGGTRVQVQVDLTPGSRVESCHTGLLTQGDQFQVMGATKWEHLTLPNVGGTVMCVSPGYLTPTLRGWHYYHFLFTAEETKAHGGEVSHPGPEFKPRPYF